MTLIKENTPLALKCKVVDKLGNSVNKVKSFDTETKELEIYVTVNGSVLKDKDNNAVIAKGFLNDLKIIDNQTGGEVK